MAAGPNAALVGEPDAGAPLATPMGDEHGGLRFGANAARPRVGELVTLMAPYCDPTVNLHDWFHLMRDGGLVDLWPIDPRGY
jgi:D-serine deaminase-like pyridoxal phosphate-dependent protein